MKGLIEVTEKDVSKSGNAEYTSLNKVAQFPGT